MSRRNRRNPPARPRKPARTGLLISIGILAAGGALVARPRVLAFRRDG